MAHHTTERSPLPRLDVRGMGPLWRLWQKMRGADHRRREVVRTINSRAIGRGPALRRLRSLVDIGLWNDAQSLSAEVLSWQHRALGYGVYQSACAASCDPVMLRLVFEGGLDIQWNEQNNRFDGWTTIFARTAQADCLRVSLAAGCNPLVRDSCDETALHLLIKQASTTIDAKDRDNTLLLCDEVIRSGHGIDDFGQTPRSMGIHHGTPVLQVAVENGSVPVVKWLLARKASTRIADGRGDFPFHWLATAHFLDQGKRWGQIANILRQGGADPDATNSRGESPSWLAAAWGNLQAVEWLLNAGADVKIDPRIYRDTQGYEKPEQPPSTLLETICKNMSPYDPVSLRLIDEVLKAKPEAWDDLTPEGVSIRDWLVTHETPSLWRPLYDHRCLQAQTPDPPPTTMSVARNRF